LDRASPTSRILTLVARRRKTEKNGRQKSKLEGNATRLRSVQKDVHEGFEWAVKNGNARHFHEEVG